MGAMYVTSWVLEKEKKRKMNAAQTRQYCSVSRKGSRFLNSRQSVGNKAAVQGIIAAKRMGMKKKILFWPGCSGAAKRVML